jgi:catalase-peroxidase
VLEPIADGFRNYQKANTRAGRGLLIDRAQLLTLTAPEMTCSSAACACSAPTSTVEARRLHEATGSADQRLLRQPARHGHAVAADVDAKDVFEGRDRKTGAVQWTGTRVDLVFGSNSQLRRWPRSTRAPTRRQKFVEDFVAAWNKVMNLDRFA